MKKTTISSTKSTNGNLAHHHTEVNKCTHKICNPPETTYQEQQHKMNTESSHSGTNHHHQSHKGLQARPED